MERTRTISAAGVEFHSHQTGEPPRAIFLHGFGGDLHTWDLLWPALSEKLSALRYDLRGFGASSASDDETPFRHADDLLAIMDVLGVDACDLVGVSMGGAVALNFALDHPQRVRRLILISPGLVAWEWSSEWRTLWRAITAQARSGDMQAARQLWWQHPLFATTRASAAAKSLRESIQRYSGRQWLRDNELHALPDVERLHALEPRTLLLTGGRDFADFRLIADLLETSAPHLTRIDWPECGHLLQLEAPTRCAAQIVDFLAAANGVGQ